LEVKTHVFHDQNTRVLTAKHVCFKQVLQTLL